LLNEETTDLIYATVILEEKSAARSGAKARKQSRTSEAKGNKRWLFAKEKRD